MNEFGMILMSKSFFSFTKAFLNKTIIINLHFGVELPKTLFIYVFCIPSQFNNALVHHSPNVHQ